MPENGPGSIGRFGRRLVAVTVDWSICTVIGVAFFGAAWGRPAESLGHALIVPAVFAVENVLLVGTAGFTVGHRLVRLRVVRLGKPNTSLIPALIRGVLVALAIPALFWDRDARGFHDKLAGTVLVRN